MTEEELKKTNIVPIVGGEVHLQNTILEKKCYICKKENDGSMVLIRQSGKDFVFVCPQHKGIVQEFIRQFKRPPIGWEVIDKPSETKDESHEKNK